MVHDLPHPGLLPKEKENNPPRLAKTCDCIGLMIIQVSRDARMLFPLLGERVRVRADVSTNHFWPTSASRFKEK
jgi:hypothetical protein